MLHYYGTTECPVGLCTKENDYGRKEKDNIKLSKEKLENGDYIWVIDVSTLPQYIYKQIPLVSYKQYQSIFKEVPHSMTLVIIDLLQSKIKLLLLGQQNYRIDAC